MLTLERAKELMEYDPVRGTLVWRVSRGPCCAGTDVGTKRPDGKGSFRRIATVDGKTYTVARLTYLFEMGCLPQNGKYVRHVDRDPSNVGRSNLRVLDEGGDDDL